MFRFNCWLVSILLLFCILFNKAVMGVDEDFNLQKLDQIPLLHILSFLSAKDLAACACTSKYLSGASDLARANSAKKAINHEINHKSSVLEMMFSPDSNFLVTRAGFRDSGKVKLYTLDEYFEQTLFGGKDVWRIAVSPDSHNVLVSHADEICLYDREEKTRKTINVAGQKHIVFTPDSQGFVASGDGREAGLKFHDLKEGASNSILSGLLNPDVVKISPGGNHLLITQGVWKQVFFSSNFANKAMEFDADCKSNATFRPDSQYFAYSHGGSIKIRNVKNGRNFCTVGTFHEESPDVLLFSSNSQYLLALLPNSSLLYDMENKAKCGNLPKEERRFNLGEFSIDNRYLALVSGKTLYTIDLKGEELEKTLQHEESIKSIAFIDDSKRILTITSDQTITDYEISSGTAKTILEKNPGSGDIATKFQISPNGKYVAFALANKKKSKFKAEVYNVENLRKRKCSDGCFAPPPLKKLAGKG